ncbi:MAG TPA: DnaJ domain-containing protein [Rhizomicrobium sp.]|nr:DnaJ domain-containing protein [Rhizomicrobium sp.]
MPFLIGAVGIVLLLLLFRIGITTDPSTLKRFSRYTAIGVLSAVAIVLGVTERWAPALFLAGVAWFLLQGGRLWPAGKPDERDIPRNEPSTGRMSRAEALRVLGLQEGATDDEIRAAHRKLILNNHPDKGGSDYLASKINEAKDVLLP